MNGPPGGGLAREAPLLAAYLQALDRRDTPFSVPGHKRRAFDIDTGLGRVVDVDVPLFAGLDTMKLTGHLLVGAEASATGLWGADWCRFGVGGASQANQALMLALGAPGDEVVIGRSIHRSVMSGLALSGLRPVWLPMHADPVGLPLGPTVADVAKALAAHPAAVAVWVTEPGYLGTTGDVAAIADTAHAHGVPLVVDQAWGAHFGFHPGYPPHAIAAGADAMVVSAHKNLPAYSQAALALAVTDRLPRHRLEAAFDATNTTSPAGAILASIDASRALLAARGTALLEQLAGLVGQARQQLLGRCPGLVVPEAADFEAGRFDPAKLVLLLAETGASGIEIETDLEDEGIALEMADPDIVVATVTLADTPETVGRLTEALAAAIQRRRRTPRHRQTPASWTIEPDTVMTPQRAFFARSCAVPVSSAVGRVSAELVAIYPPGIPILAPGERVTDALLAMLRDATTSGSRVAYAADPGLKTLRIVDSV